MDITLFPIPASDMVTVYFNNALMDNSIVEIKNATGQLIRKISITATPTYNKKDIDISRLERGIYILTITSGNRIFTKKFCKI